jgi:hypothetical protein
MGRARLADPARGSMSRFQVAIGHKLHHRDAMAHRWCSHEVIDITGNVVSVVAACGYTPLASVEEDEALAPPTVTLYLDVLNEAGEAATFEHGPAGVHSAGVPLRFFFLGAVASRRLTRARMGAQLDLP